MIINEAGGGIGGVEVGVGVGPVGVGEVGAGLKTGSFPWTKAGDTEADTCQHWHHAGLYILIHVNSLSNYRCDKKRARKVFQLKASVSLPVL
jgi:hypothetical protein